MLGTAREAFAQAFEFTAGVSAAVALATAVLALVRLRRREDSTPQPREI